MIKSHLGNLEKKNYQAIARDLKQPLEEIYEAAKVIMEFDPRPGRQYSSDDPHYVTPDVYIHKVGDKYFVVPNDDGLPKLKISGFYKNAMGNRRREQGLRPGQAALGAVADPLDPAAPAHDHQGHRVDPEVPARVLRQGHRAPQAADPARRRRGHRHARVHGLARDDDEVRPHAAGHLRAEVLLQQRHLAHQRRGPRVAGREVEDQGAGRRPRIRSGRTPTRRSSSCSRRAASTSPAAPSRSTASSSAS